MKELISNKPYDVILQKVEEGFLLLDWPTIISEKINSVVIPSAERLRELNVDGIIDVVPTYHSIGIYYDQRTNYQRIVEVLKSLHFEMGAVTESEIKEVPVCYDPKFGIDLHEFSQVKDLSIDEIVSTHVNTVYKVNFIGFLPGFLYLSGLPQVLTMDRRATPRTHIPSGSVGIGGNQTGIYPLNSPGGWNFIGRCPWKLFDINRNEPCRFQAGDRISFESIGLKEFWSLNEHKDKS